MRPLELSLSGFTSFRDEQHIDFSQLDLFAITGATGAGKSSLLDAITYALYGKTARTGSQIQELVSQGASILKVQLRFALPQGEYRVTRRWRDRGKTTVNTVLLEAYEAKKWETLETKERAANKEIEQIVGMDFDTFTRVILLPQGQFDEFLKGNTKKRREILRQLAGFEIFEQMRKEANSLAGLFKKELEAVERQIGELEAPQEWEVEQKIGELTALETELSTLERAVWQAQKKLDEEQQLFDRLGRLMKLQKELAALSLNAERIASLEARLERSHAAASLQGNWTLVQEARRQAGLAEKQATLAAQQLQKVQAKLAKEKEKLDKAKAQQLATASQFKEREDALATVKVYEQQREEISQEILRVQKILLQKTTDLAAVQQKWQQIQRESIAATQEVEQRTAELEKYTPGGDRLETLKQLSPLLMEWQLIDSQFKKQQKQQQALQKKLETSGLVLKEAQFRQELANSAMDRAREALVQGEINNAEATRLDRAAVLRESLLSGETCPVCGGVYDEHHPLPELEIPELLDLSPLRDRLQTTEKQFQATQRQVTKAETTLEQQTQQMTVCVQELSEEENRLTVKQATISEFLTAAEISPNFGKTASKLQQEYKQLQLSDRQYKQVQQQHQAAVARLTQIRQALEFEEKSYKQAQQQEQTARSEVDRQLKAGQELTIVLEKITGGLSYDQLRKNLTREQQQLQTQLQQAENAYQRIHQQAIAAATENAQATDTAQTATLKQTELNTDWLEKLQAANFTETDFLSAQSSAREKAAWQQQIRDYRETKVRLETRFNDLQEEIGENTTDEETLNRCQLSLNAAREKYKQANDRRTELSTWIQVSQGKLEHLNVLETQQQALSEEAETYHTLANNLKTNEFQAYILENLEVELLARATTLLKELSDSRYALAIEQGEYWVEDNWNGGEKRRVRTLSGGETFAASLSMALALSERLSMGAHLGSLFLDEGFGTLDTETLEAVTQILETLRQRSRMIGVITHVRALAERLPTQVRVYKSPNGSRIEVEML